MRRALALVAVLAAAAAFALTSAGAGGGSGAPHFTVAFDNAFGLVEGADLKIAGVRAGKITKLRLDRRTRHALVDFEVAKTGFGSLREDVFCESRPQSLIGEYFVDCRPGTSPKQLPDGATIPVTRTASTIPADLVNDIMRRPYRERLRIILSELGLGVGARADQLNEAIRRASPALRETDKVLGVLGRQNLVLRNLVTDADAVLRDMAGNRADVGRWITDTGKTASASAERRQDIAAGLRKLPAFLAELQPTMAELGRAADAQTPTLVDLNASAGRLEHFFTTLKPFTDSTHANLRSLAGAAKEGGPAVRAARPLVAELNRFSQNTPELASNLRITLSDLNDRGRAIEKDPRSPGGQGYTGFEAILQYVYDQAMAINVYDDHGYMLKANIFHSECSEYQNAESLTAKMKQDPEFYKRCASILGPTQLGILQADPTKPAEKPAQKKKKRAAKRHKAADRPADAPKDEAPRDTGVRPPIDLGQTIDDLLGGKLPQLLPQVPGVTGVAGGIQELAGSAAGTAGTADGRDAQQALLDYLLSP
jgi:ABC-type transporter Mla subunit MlaD